MDGSMMLANNARNAAPDVSSCRFTRKYLLEQLRVRFLPGMSDPEAEETLAMKFRREHVGAELETAARLASDTYRHQRDTLKIQDKFQAAAGAVGSTAGAAGRVVGRWLASAGSGLLDGVMALGGSGRMDSAGPSGGGAKNIKYRKQVRAEEDAAARHARKSSGEAEEWVDLEKTLR